MLGSDAYGRQRGADRVPMTFNGLFVGPSAGTWTTQRDAPYQLTAADNMTSNASPASSSGATVIRQRSTPNTDATEHADALRRAAVTPQKCAKQPTRSRSVATGYAHRHSQRAAYAAAGAASITPASVKPQIGSGRTTPPGPRLQGPNRHSDVPLGNCARSTSPKTGHSHMGSTASAVIAALAVDAAMPDIDPTARALLEAIMGSTLESSGSMSRMPSLPLQSTPSLTPSTLPHTAATAPVAASHAQPASACPDPFFKATAAKAAAVSGTTESAVSVFGQPVASARHRAQPQQPQPWPLPPATFAMPPNAVPAKPKSRQGSPRVGAESEGQAAQRPRASQEQLQQPSKFGSSAGGLAQGYPQAAQGAIAQQPAELPPGHERRSQLLPSGSAQASLPELQQSQPPEAALGHGTHVRPGDEPQGARRRLGVYASDSDVQLPRRPPSSPSATGVQPAAAQAQAGVAGGTGAGTSPSRALIARMCRSHAAGSLSSKNLRAMRESQESRRPTTYAELQAAAKPQSPADLSPVRGQHQVLSGAPLPPLPPSDGGACDSAVPVGVAAAKALMPGDDSCVFRASGSLHTDADKESASHSITPAASRKSSRLTSGKSGSDVSNGRSSKPGLVGGAADMPDVAEEPDATPVGQGNMATASANRRLRHEGSPKRPLLCGLLACFRRAAASPESGEADEPQRDDADVPASPLSQWRADEQVVASVDATPVATPRDAVDGAGLYPALPLAAPGGAIGAAAVEAAHAAAATAAVVAAPPEDGSGKASASQQPQQAAIAPHEQRPQDPTRPLEASPRTPRSPAHTPLRPSMASQQHQQLHRCSGPVNNRYNDAATRSVGGGGIAYQRLSRHASPRNRCSNDGEAQAVREGKDESLFTAVAARPQQVSSTRFASRAGGTPELLEGAVAAVAAVPISPTGGSSTAPAPRPSISGTEQQEKLVQASADDMPAPVMGGQPAVTRALGLEPPSRPETGSPRLWSASQVPLPSQSPPLPPAQVSSYQPPKMDAQQSGNVAEALGLFTPAATVSTGLANAKTGQQSVGGSSSGGYSESSSANVGVQTAPATSTRKSRKRGRTANPGGTLAQLDARKLAALPLEEMLEQIQAAMYAEDLARGRAGDPVVPPAAGRATAIDAILAAAKPTRQGSMRRRKSAAGARSTAGGSTTESGVASQAKSANGAPSGGRRRRRVKALGRSGNSKRKARAEAAAAAALAAALQHGNKDKGKEQSGQPTWRHGGRALAYNGLGIAGTPISGPLPAPQPITQRGSFDGSFLRQPPYKKTVTIKGPPSPTPTPSLRRQAAEPAPSSVVRYAQPPTTPVSRYAQSAAVGAGAEAAQSRPSQTTSRKQKATRQAAKHTVITINPIPVAAAATTTATPMNTPAPAPRSPLTTSLDLSSLLSCCGGDVGVVIGAATKSPRGAPGSTARTHGEKPNSPTTSVKAATTALAELVRLMDNGVDSGAVAVAVMSAHAAAENRQPPLDPVLGAAKMQPAAASAPRREHRSASVSLAGMLNEAANCPEPPPLVSRYPQRQDQPGDGECVLMSVAPQQAKDKSFTVLASDVNTGVMCEAEQDSASVHKDGLDKCSRAAPALPPFSSGLLARTAGSDVSASDDAVCIGATGSSARLPTVRDADASPVCKVPPADGAMVAAAFTPRGSAHRRCASALAIYEELLTADQSSAPYASPASYRRASHTVGGDAECNGHVSVGTGSRPQTARDCGTGYSARPCLLKLVTDGDASGSGIRCSMDGGGPVLMAETAGSTGGEPPQRDLISPSVSVPDAVNAVSAADGSASCSGNSSIVAMAMGDRGPLSSPFKATPRARRAGADSARSAADVASARDPALVTELAVDEDGGSSHHRRTRSGSIAAYDIHAAAAAETPALVYNAALSPRSSTGGESYPPAEDMTLRALRAAVGAMRVTTSAPPSVAGAASAEQSAALHARMMSPRLVALPVTPRMPDGGHGGDWRCVSLEQYEQSLGDFDAFLAMQTSRSG